MKKFNNYINLGLLFNGIFLLGNGTNLMPEFIKGFFLGLGIVFIFHGMFLQNHSMLKIRKFKESLFRK